MQEMIEAALAEDVGPGDVTSESIVPADAVAAARIDQKQPGVISGLRAAEAVFRTVDPALRWHPHATDGSYRETGLIAEVAGPARSLLTGERTALNFLQRLSGVATLTARYVAAVAGTNARILDTRKTTPGLRVLEKQAVLAGGGTVYRTGLYDAILVKENHGALAGGVGEATRIALAEGEKRGVPVEVECSTLDEVRAALDAGLDRLLLDNMSLDELRASVELNAGRALLEASGGVSLDTVRDIA